MAKRFLKITETKDEVSTTLYLQSNNVKMPVST